MGKEKERIKTANGEMKKESAETKTNKAKEPTIRDTPTHKILTKPKEKEIAKDPKEKEKTKASQDTVTERLVGKTKRPN